MANTCNNTVYIISPVNDMQTSENLTKFSQSIVKIEKECPGVSIQHVGPESGLKYFPDPNLLEKMEYGLWTRNSGYKFFCIEYLSEWTTSDVMNKKLREFFKEVSILVLAEELGSTYLDIIYGNNSLITGKGLEDLYNDPTWQGIINNLFPQAFESINGSGND